MAGFIEKKNILSAGGVSLEDIAREHGTPLFVYSAESVPSQAFWLGLAESVADLAWLDGFLDSLAAVTAEDVQRVARAYLGERNRTVGWYLPESGE